MIAFLGLGRMGAPMAHRLITAGHELVVWNRTATRTEPLVAAGATAAATPAEAVRDADLVITMLADPAAVESVVTELAPAFPSGSCLVEMSSIGPAAVAAVRALLPARAGLVDAPVLGSVGPAATGDLRILAGGDTADLDRVESTLATLGTVTRCGPSGSGSALKVVLISGVISGTTLIGEVLAVADALGVTNAREVLSSTPLAALADRAFAERADFPVSLAAKDLGLAPLNLPMIRAAREALLRVPDQDTDLGGVVAHIRAEN